MPESPQLSYAEAEAARDKFRNAWDRKWFKPQSWFRPHVGTGLGAKGKEGWQVVVLLERESYRKAVQRVLKRTIPNIPVDVRVSGVIRAAAS